MKKIFIFIIFIFFTSNYSLGNEYKEINTFSQLNTNLPNDIGPSLIIIRLDNTLMRLEQMLGSIEWVENRKAQLQCLSLTEEKALRQTLLEWITIQNLTKCKLIDEEAGIVLKDLQNMGYNILIITERPFHLIRATHSQLKNLNLDLSSSYYGNQLIIMSTPNSSTFSPIVLQNGVLFTSGILNTMNFSTALNLLFTHSYFPKNIVYIDQKKNYIEDVELFCQKESINFLGLRFSTADKEINIFNERIADIQLSYLQSFFSPETLNALMKVKN